MLRAKLRAREILSGNYLKVTAILFISLISALVITNIKNIVSFFSENIILEYRFILIFAFSLVTVILSLLILPSLKSGREKWFYSRAKGNTATFKLFFSCFKNNFAKSIGIWLFMRILYSFWAAVMLSPAIVLIIITVNNFKNGISLWIGISLIAGSSLFALLGLSFFLIVIQRYFLVYYITVSSSVGAFKSIILSAKIMRDKCLKTLRFKLSFVPWILPCLFILPIIYVWGYYKQSCACLAEEYMSFLSVHPKSITYKF